MDNDVDSPAGSEAVLRAAGLSKSFFGVPVLSNADLTLFPGQVHGLVGENGAGKSTLMKLLAGVHQRDSGTIEIAGQAVDFSHPTQAHAAGLSTVFQEFNLLPERSVAENIFLGREPRRGILTDTRTMQARTSELLAELGVSSIRPGSPVSSLSVAQQQIVEIAKAISYDARIISMDEPTAALAGPEVELLYEIIRRLTSRGVAVLYVSHRLKEIFDLCDIITVLKDGQVVGCHPASELDDAALVRLMVGRPISAYFPDIEPGTAVGEVVLRAEKCGNDQLDSIDLSLRTGEIVGVAGLQGSGRTELLEALFGAAPFTRGTMELSGVRYAGRSPREAVRRGIALITEDRKSEGLSLNQSILDNALSVVRSVFPSRNRKARAGIPAMFSSLEVGARDLSQEVQYLSGGNQQKVVLAKWLAVNPRVVLLDEPTRGIDVGAKLAVYQLMRSLAANGAAILMVSSEIPEVLGMADRILVLRDGRIAGTAPPESTEEEVLALAAGVRADQEASQ
ncbi:sugar ABC transporter ATP-binding protein [Arthrobacter sp. Br18]|uniref:sugar ABC transporter ATP-binding protein n=1 Tax=Arthrobacter sp. Br18 TaxID=1312954 RepID=UPI0004B8BAE7|nr:sugar ABC transporter ATP-binding protein [Arthrobacter sp. Br18]